MNTNMNPVKTRFAPSPTGLMHFGNLRVALFNYLYTKRYQGCFLLRIEDTDAARSHQSLEQAIEEDLKWLQLSWDEGPYRQSERQAIYESHYKILKTQGHIYPCFCSEEKLALHRKQQLAQGKPPRYSGTCFKLSEEERSKKIAEGLPHTLRFHVPPAGVIEFDDLIKGHQKFDQEHIGDFIIARQDGSASFMYCNAIDDAEMGVTIALRGDDHLTNTPRQILILKALGLPIPSYGHFSTILGPDSRPLSKRNGSRSIKELREEGFLPSAIMNYLSRLGHHYKNQGSKDELLSLEALAEGFDLKNISLAPAHYDATQLEHWQKLAMMKLSIETCWKQIEVYAVKALELTTNTLNREPIFSVNDLLKMSQHIVEMIQPNLLMPKDAEPILYSIFMGLSSEKAENEAIKNVLIQNNQLNSVLIELQQLIQNESQESKPTIEQCAEWLNKIKHRTGKKGKEIFLPIRLALTGETDGPELKRIMHLLGPKQILGRIDMIGHHSIKPG